MRQRLLADTEDPDVNWETLDHYAEHCRHSRSTCWSTTRPATAFTYRQTARAAVSREMYLNRSFCDGMLGIRCRPSSPGCWPGAGIIGPGRGGLCGGRRDRGRQTRRRLFRWRAPTSSGRCSPAMRLDARQHQDDDGPRGGPAASAQAARRRARSSREGVVVVDARGPQSPSPSRRQPISRRHRSMALQARHARSACPRRGADLSRREPGSRPNCSPTARSPCGRTLAARQPQRHAGEAASIVVCSDISVLKEQEARPQRNESPLRRGAQQHGARACALYDAENWRLVVNRRFGEIFNLPPERVRPGMPFAQIVATQLRGREPSPEDRRRRTL